WPARSRETAAGRRSRAERPRARSDRAAVREASHETVETESAWPPADSQERAPPRALSRATRDLAFLRASRRGRDSGTACAPLRAALRALAEEPSPGPRD